MYTQEDLNKIFETVTAEFSSNQIIGDYDSLRVKLNGKKVSIKKALEMAKTDQGINRMFANLKKKQKEENLDYMPFLEFLNLYLSDDDDFWDYIEKDGVTTRNQGGKETLTKPAPKIDTKEIEKNKQRMSKRSPASFNWLDGSLET